MKTKTKILKSSCNYLDEDIPGEIDFSNGSKNPFAKQKKISVELEPDVAEVFSNSQEVNSALRIIIKSAKRITAAL